MKQTLSSIYGSIFYDSDFCAYSEEYLLTAIAAYNSMAKWCAINNDEPNYIRACNCRNIANSYLAQLRSGKIDSYSSLVDEYLYYNSAANYARLRVHFLHGWLRYVAEARKA